MVKTCLVCFPRCVATFLLLCVGAISYAQSAAQDRVLGPIDDSHMYMVEGNRLALARPEFDQGRVDGAMKINRASIVFKPSPAQQNALETLLAEQQDRSSANYHKWLTPEQYADRFGMTPSDLAKISSWLQSRGLTVNETARGRNQIFFSGTVAQIEDAFRTEIHHYLINGETHFANAIEPSAPAAFADAVRGFRGLDDFRPKPRSHVVKPHFTSSLSGNHYVAPGDFVTIYDLQKLYNSGFDGTGETIAVVGASAITMSDIEAFRTASNLPKNDPQIIVVPGTGTPTHNSAETEADLDLEWSGAVARGADIIYVVVGPSANNGAFDALSFAIQNKVAPIISNSFGNCEANLGGAGAGSFVLMLQQEARQANLQGQTITSATGDSGAADCEAMGSTSATSGLAVDVPASIPEVTGVGGSEFNPAVDPKATLDPSNSSCYLATTYWSKSCSPTSGPSALTPFAPEMAWNDTPVTGTGLATSIAAGGGGASAVFPKPNFQTFVPTPNDSKRDVPDISLNASSDHDGYLFCTAGSCVNNSYRGSDGQSLAVVGGTSAGAPTFAGILAIINQATRAATPTGQGNANLELYTLAKSTSAAFPDITTGSNIVPCTKGTTGCPASAPFQYGFMAGVGYDQVTGLGSIDANVLVRNWTNFLTTPDFAVGGTAVNLSAPGQSSSSTITVIPMNGFSSTTVNLSLTTACPTAAFITCTLSPSSVSVNGSSATATLSVSTMAPHALAGSSTEARTPAGLGWLAASAGILLAGFFAMGVPSRRRRWAGLLGLLFLTFVAAGLSCGGGSSPHQLTGGTPVGTYTVTITAADASGIPSHATNVTITVQ